jgi:hypothetical protein
MVGQTTSFRDRRNSFCERGGGSNGGRICRCLTLGDISPLPRRLRDALLVAPSTPAPPARHGFRAPVDRSPAGDRRGDPGVGRPGSVAPTDLLDPVHPGHYRGTRHGSGGSEAAVAEPARGTMQSRSRARSRAAALNQRWGGSAPRLIPSCGLGSEALQSGRAEQLRSADRFGVGRR